MTDNTNVILTKSTRANTTIPDKEYNAYLKSENFPVAKRAKVDTATFRQDLSRGSSGYYHLFIYLFYHFIYLLLYLL